MLERGGTPSLTGYVVHSVFFLKLKILFFMGEVVMMTDLVDIKKITKACSF